jgi:CRISPR/Cas system-associated exonuclease Cas4 (RecB family)
MKIGEKEFPYSFSQNRLYNDCPRKYKYRYVDGIKEPTNENLELGSAIHKVLEFYTSFNPTDDSVVHDAIETIIKYKGTLYWNKLNDELNNLEQIKDEYNLGRELSINRDDFISVIDLAHNYAAQSHKYTLADYKVTKKPKTEDSIYDEGQLLIYKYLWCLEHPQVKPDDVWVQYINILPYLSAKIITVTEPHMVSFETCENLFNQVQATKQKILSGEFPKKKKWCRWCFYKDKCDQDCD